MQHAPRLGLLSLAFAAACGAAAPTTPDALPAGDAPPDAPADDAPPDAATAPRGYIGAYKSPSIVRDGATFHAYFAADRVAGAHRNIPHATFTADGDWTFVGDALPHLGAHALAGPGSYPVWAPSVAQIDATHWVLYYTAQLEGTEQKKCIWRAHAAGPNGPFVDDHAGPIACPPGSLWAIDPYVVKDAQGRWHLAARIDEPGGINTIQLRELDAQGESFAAGSTWVPLTRNAPDSWEQPVLENAGVVRLTPPTGPAHWFVFYSGGAWNTNSYAIGYADCGTAITGPCVKKTPAGPWLATDPGAGVYGPGTPTFYGSGTGDALMSVQAWQYPGGTGNPQNAKGQIMRTYQLAIDDGYLPTATLLRVDR